MQHHLVCQKYCSLTLNLTSICLFYAMFIVERMGEWHANELLLLLCLFVVVFFSCQKSKWNLGNMKISYQVTRISVNNCFFLLYLFIWCSRWTLKKSNTKTIFEQVKFRQTKLICERRRILIFFFVRSFVAGCERKWDDWNSRAELTLLWNFRSASTYWALFVQIDWAWIASASGQGILIVGSTYVRHEGGRIIKT